MVFLVGCRDVLKPHPPHHRHPPPTQAGPGHSRSKCGLTVSHHVARAVVVTAHEGVVVALLLLLFTWCSINDVCDLFDHAHPVDYLTCVHDVQLRDLCSK